MTRTILIALAGFLLALVLPLNLEESLVLYLSLSVLVLIASLLEIIVDIKEEKGDFKKWSVEITSNLLLSTFLTFISLRLKIPLYYATIIFFGTKIFDNTGKIRYFLLR